SRVVKVVPIEDEAPLRNRDWVEGNLRKVTEATNGRVAYVYVPNTAGAGHTYFKRYFFPQADRDAVIVDERHNGGGSVADYYIDILRRPLISHWAMRYGGDLKTPLASIQGPKVMIIDETAGSGGDLLLKRPIQIAMKQLAENPPKKETRPPFPVRAPSAKQ